MSRRPHIHRIALVALALALGAASCSSGGSDADRSTTSVSTSTTKPEITDGEIKANISEEIRPALETAFAPDQVGCILDVMKASGVGQLSADDALGAYQERCGVSAAEVAGVVAAADLLDRGASKEGAACVRSAISELSIDKAESLDATEVGRIYEKCGVGSEGP
jgi:hypothetical protein